MGSCAFYYGFLLGLYRIELQDPGSQVHVTVEICPHTPLSVCCRKEAASMPRWGGSTEDGCSEMTVEMHLF